MKRVLVPVLSFALLACTTELASAENDPLSTKRRPALQRLPKAPPRARIGQPSHHDDTAEREDWKQIDDLRSAGRHGKGGGGRGGGRDDDGEGSDD